MNSRFQIPIGILGIMDTYIFSLNWQTLKTNVVCFQSAYKYYKKYYYCNPISQSLTGYIVVRGVS